MVTCCGRCLICTRHTHGFGSFIDVIAWGLVRLLGCPSPLASYVIFGIIELSSLLITTTLLGAFLACCTQLGALGVVITWSSTSKAVMAGIGTIFAFLAVLLHDDPLVCAFGMLVAAARAMVMYIPEIF